MKFEKEAKFYTKKDNLSVSCDLCPHNCFIKNGKTGICGVREVVDGTLYTHTWAKVSSFAIDPIEKKPLYNFFPSSSILSVGTVGCNLKCPFCQNWQISQDVDIRTKTISPEELVKRTLETDSIGIAFTYNEPTLWIEYILETAKIAKNHNLKIVLVTNGQINLEPLQQLLPFVDAMNIDLKSFSGIKYKKILKGDLETTLRTIEVVNKSDCHLEITTLVVTGLNDSIGEMSKIVDWIASINNQIPLHLSRYFPNYNYNEVSTDLDFLQEVYEMAVRKLKYVYLGNCS